MNGRVLAAGWPISTLLALEASGAGRSGVARVRGLIVENDDRSGILVLESSDVTGPLATDPATGFYGVDGYPIGCGDVDVGDTV